MMLELNAASSSCILYCFTRIILGLERVVCLAGYQFPLSITRTAALL